MTAPAKSDADKARELAIAVVAIGEAFAKARGFDRPTGLAAMLELVARGELVPAWDTQEQLLWKPKW